MRYILHSDLNNFYASVESLYNKDIRNKPVVVAGDVKKRHGIILAKNYIAKDMGVKTGDTVWEARQKCGENLCSVPARFDLYLSISHMVKDIYREYSDRVESFGIDEAWIDVSHLVSNFIEAEKLAHKIRVRIISEMGLTVSIGVSFNKIFAKLGSDLKKPNAVTVITPENYQKLVWNLPVDDLLYVGRATSHKFERVGIRTIGELAHTDEKYLKLLLGKNGEALHKFANGLDDSEVSSIHDEKIIKSFGNSTTCPVDLKTNNEVKSIIYMLSECVAERMRVGGYFGNTISLWVKDEMLESFECQMHIISPTNISSDIAKCAYQLFLEHYDWGLNIRALGVRISGLGKGEIQYNLFDTASNFDKRQKLERAIESLRSRFGYEIIRRGNILVNASLSTLNPHSETHIIHPVGFFGAKL